MEEASIGLVGKAPFFEQTQSEDRGPIQEEGSIENDFVEANLSEVPDKQALGWSWKRNARGIREKLVSKDSKCGPETCEKEKYERPTLENEENARAPKRSRVLTNEDGGLLAPLVDAGKQPCRGQ